jgi:tetratricopeptide (TPR) repeat protein
VPRLAVSSTAEEWAKSGRTLFRSKRYYQAMHCFERAEMPRETAIAHAYLLRDTARNLLGGSKTQASERAQAFADAADAFVQCAKREQSEERATYFRVAGECFAQANEHLKAGQAFYEASEYTLSARQYRKGDHFDEAVEVVQNHDVDPAFAATLVDVAKFYYITSGAPE